MMQLLALFNLLLAASLASGGESIDVNTSLLSLCKNSPVDITKISEVVAIAEHLRNAPPSLEDCAEDVQGSILDLASVVDDADDVCSMRKVEQIRVYHTKYVQYHSKDANPILPESLKLFFIGYSLTVSSICKKTMINNLIFDTRQYLTPEDFEALDLWTKNEAAFIVNGPADYDDLLLAGDLIRLTESTESEKIFIQTGSSHLLDRIRSICQKRFRPFYEKLILPVVTLSNIGYNYQGEELERELREMRSNKEVRQWYEIVYLCQALEDTELVETKEDSEKTEGLDRKLVKILTKGEAEALRETSPDDDKSPCDDGLEQIIYKPEGGNPIGDVILNGNDKNLNRLIKNFDSNKSDLDRIRSKLFWKMGSFLKENLMKGNFKIIVSTLFKSKNNDKQESANPRTEMVRAFDDYVQRMERSDDNPVAGLRDLGKRTYHNAAYLGPSGIAHKAAEKTIAPFNYGLAFWRIVAVVLLVVALAITVSALT